jgi:hypothetical protein
MNAWQNEQYKAFKGQLDEQIKDRSNLLNALNLIVYNPKKDGTEKANFQANFAFRDLGESHPVYHGRQRFATVEPYETCEWETVDNVRRAKNYVTGLKISTAWLSKDEAKKVGLDDLNHTENTIRFSSKKLGLEEIKFDTQTFTAKQAVEIIGKYAKMVEAQLEQIKSEAARLPEFFKECIEMADRIHDFKAKYKESWCFYGMASTAVEKSYMFETKE